MACEQVWIVVGDWGQWSDHMNWNESIWDSEEAAIEHIVQDLGGSLKDDNMYWVTEDEDDWEPTFWSIEHRRVHKKGDKHVSR